MRKINKIIVHCSATRPSQDIGAAEIDSWHRKEGYDRIGYHYVIRRDGTLEEGRNVEKAGAHAYGHNAHSIGICLVGGVDDNMRPQDNFAPLQYMTLQECVDDLQRDYDVNDADIIGHRDLPGVAKDCPCFDVRAWWDRCRAGILNARDIRRMMGAKDA